MTDYPYAGPNTLTPGETVDDDPDNDKDYCPRCDDYVLSIGGGNGPDTCSACGTEVRK